MGNIDYIPFPECQGLKLDKIYGNMRYTIRIQKTGLSEDL
jgi:hypothetical protein